MENREVINDVLVHLFNEIMELEEQAIITEEYKDITNNDMHIIEAVGLGGNKMSDIAGIKNWFNEFFAKDTSRKIRAVNKAKGERGERLTTNVPYGYKHFA